MAPTLYYLFFNRNKFGEYDVFEAHRHQGEGGLLTEDLYIGTCLPGKIEEFVNEFHNKCKESNGKLENFEVDYIEVE